MCDELARLGLFFELERPFNTLVVDLIDDIVSDLRRSDHEYAFAVPPFQSAHRHESLELQLLALHNKGYKQRGQSWLSPAAVSPSLSVAGLCHTDNRLKFCSPSLTIVDGQFRLFFGATVVPPYFFLQGLFTVFQLLQNSPSHFAYLVPCQTRSGQSSLTRVSQSDSTTISRGTAQF